MGRVLLLVGLWGCGLGFSEGRIHYAPNWNNIEIARSDRRPIEDTNAFKQQVVQSCRQMALAYSASRFYFNQIQTYIGNRGVNFPVYYQNRGFYESRMGRRLNACQNEKLYFRFVGRCGTAQGTLAYVRTPFGIVLSTINICDEFFEASASTQASVLMHEFGRLEGIGDSPNFDTNNIHVWDAVVGRIGDPETFQAIQELAPNGE